jgi:hypothetical protein
MLCRAREQDRGRKLRGGPRITSNVHASDLPRARWYEIGTNPRNLPPIALSFERTPASGAQPLWQRLAVYYCRMHITIGWSFEGGLLCVTDRCVWS